MKLPNMKKPCDNCPFLKTTLKGWLGEERMTGILKGDSFTCHKTTDTKTEDRKQCAGFMLLKGRESSFVELSTRLGMSLMLGGRKLVFETKDDCINYHKN